MSSKLRTTLFAASVVMLLAVGTVFVLASLKYVLDEKPLPVAAAVASPSPTPEGQTKLRGIALKAGTCVQAGAIFKIAEIDNAILLPDGTISSTSPDGVVVFFTGAQCMLFAR